MNLYGNINKFNCRPGAIHCKLRHQLCLLNNQQPNVRSYSCNSALWILISNFPPAHNLELKTFALKNHLIKKKNRNNKRHSLDGINKREKFEIRNIYLKATAGEVVCPTPKSISPNICQINIQIEPVDRICCGSVVGWLMLICELEPAKQKRDRFTSLSANSVGWLSLNIIIFLCREHSYFPDRIC